MDDAFLLEAWRLHRDEGALGALMQRHSPGLRAALRRRLADPAQVDDALQATWIVLSRKAGAVRDPGRLAGWLHATAGRIALDLLRAAKRRRAAEGRAGEDPMGEQRPDEILAEDEERRFLRSRLDEALQRVSHASREAILRHFLHGQSRTEAAAACGVSEGAFQMRLDYGLRQLRGLLGRRGRPASLAAILGILSSPGLAAEAIPSLASILTPAAPAAALATECIRAMTKQFLLKAAAGVAFVLLAGGGIAVAVDGPATPPAPTVPSPARREHVVVAGETLASISKAYFGSEAHWQAIAKANPGLVVPASGAMPALSVGQRLRLPDIASAGRSAANGSPTANAEEAKAPAATSSALDQEISVDFQDSDFADVLAYLQRLSGVPMRLAADSGQIRPLTLKVDAIPLRHTLDYLARLSGLQFRHVDGAVVFSKP